jgi:hypothetical protein
MKKISTTREGKKLVVPQHGYFRRLISLLIGSIMRHQNDNGPEKIKKISERVQDLEDSMEIMSHEMARQSKKGK